MKFSTLVAVISVAVAMSSSPTNGDSSKDYYTVPVADLAKNNMTEDMIRTDLTPVSQESTPTVAPTGSKPKGPLSLTPTTKDGSSNYHTVRVADLPKGKMTDDMIRTNLTPVSQGSAPTTSTTNHAGSNYYTVPVKDLPKYNKGDFINLIPTNQGSTPTIAPTPCSGSSSSSKDGSSNYHTVRVADLPKGKMTDDMIRTNLTPVSQGSPATPSAN